MKKLLLSIGVLATVADASAQWQEQNTLLTPARDIFNISITSEKVAWASGQATTQGAACTDFVRTVDGGTTWKKGKVSAINHAFGNLFALDSSNAYAAMFNLAGGGGIYKTTNGGAAWTKVSKTDMFVAPEGFPNFVHFWDADNGITMGDPTNGEFEIWKTSNGGTSWTRIDGSKIPDPNVNEYGVVNYYQARGNSIWFTTLINPDDPSISKRVFRSTDKGETWSVIELPFFEGVVAFDFKDEQNGLLSPAFDQLDPYFDLYKTSDGGVTWSQVNIPTTGSDQVAYGDLTYVPGTPGTYVSVGLTFRDVNNTALGTMPYTAYSLNDGATWKMIDTTNISTVSFYNKSVGFGGSLNPTATKGGMYKWTGNLAGVSQPKKASGMVFVAPNPSENGVFNLRVKAIGTSTVSIKDLTGRIILSKDFTTSTELDLSAQAKGMYIAEVINSGSVESIKLMVK